MRKVILVIVLALLTAGVLVWALETRIFEPSPPHGIWNWAVYIRPDGTIDPPTAPVQRTGNYYTLTGNITVDGYGIVVGRGNIVFDGGGCILQGRFPSGNGIDLTSTNNVTIKNTNIESFEYGISLDSSSNTTLSGNNVTGNFSYGIYIRSSSHSTLFQNAIDNNTHNLAVFGSVLSDFMNSIDASNLVNGNPVYYYVNQEGLAINPSTHPNVGYLGLINCTNITVENLTLTNSGGEGVLLAYTANSTITRNRVANNVDGIHLDFSSNNTLSGNNATGSWCGIYLDFCSGNIVSDNNAAGNNYGIKLDSSDNNTVSVNDASGNSYGIYLGSSSGNTVSGNDASGNSYGIYLGSSSNNTVSGNSMSQNSYCGVEVYSSSDNTLSGNNVTGNSDMGISLDSSSGNVFFQNVIGNNVYNLGVSGFKLSDYVDSIDTSNLVNGKPVYYYVNEEDLAINPSTHPNVGYLGLINCTNITVEHLVITGNLQGVLLAYTNDSTVTENDLASNTFGIYLEGSSGNTVSGNDVTENSEAIWLDSSSDNTVFYNNFMHNLHQIYSGDLTNAWDNGYPSGGNFWSNYDGVDEKRGPEQDQLGSDGIGDTPFNGDHYPLMQPWSGLPQSYNGNLRVLHA